MRLADASFMFSAIPLVEDGSAVAALLLGALGSAHCLVMCGPLACAASADEPIVLGRAAQDRHAQRRRAAVAWHLGRIAGYTAVGALLGTFGRGVSMALTRSITPALPWVLAGALLLSALVPRQAWSHLPTLPGGTQIRRLWRWLRVNISQVPRAALLGALTPLLPCGLLYAMFAAAIASGSTGQGAVLGGAFALGAVPALAAAQLGSRWLARAPAWSRRVVPVVAALVLIWRAAMTTTHHACH